jgi:hypothetical protein
MRGKETNMLQGIKHLSFQEDSVLGSDSNKINAVKAAREQGGLAGLVVLRNPLTGEELLRKWNLITLRGRVLALELLFNDPVPLGTSQGSVNYVTGAQSLTRSIIMFSIGSGGAPAADPFNPVVPAYSDMALATPEAFRKTDTTNATTLAQFPALTPAEQMVYYNAVTSGTITQYYSKRFDVLQPAWTVDTVNNEAYKKIILRIGDLDARGKTINELALQVANYNSGTNAMSGIEQFTRITFASESLVNPSKQLLVEYYIYA